MLVPDVSFKLKPITSLKFALTPLSKIILNKGINPNDSSTKSNFNAATGFYSGFISLDSKGRIIPLMPNDP
jgi:hypothetical protein